MTIFLASFGFGLLTAAVLAIASVGFTMQFAVTDVLNLAYGAVMIAAAYIAYTVNQAGVTIWIAMLAAAGFGAAVSLVVNRVVYTPFQRRRASPIALVIVSLGMTLIIEFGLQAIVGGTNVSYTMSMGPTINAGGLQLTVVQLVIIGLSLVVMALVHVLLHYTRLGKAMRATAANRSLARNCGIRTDRVVAITWVLTGALCGIAGTVFAIDIGSFGATSTDLFLVLILAAVFLGGPGNAYGAMLGATVIGLATEVSAAYITPSYKYAVAGGLLLLMLAIRPSGLLGQAAWRRGPTWFSTSRPFSSTRRWTASRASGSANSSASEGSRTSVSSSSRRPAYTAAILSLPSDTANGGFQSYIGGLNLPFPWPFIGAAAAGALVAIPFVFLVGRRLRGDFAAVGLLVAAVIANLVRGELRPALRRRRWSQPRAVAAPGLLQSPIGRLCMGIHDREHRLVGDRVPVRPAHHRVPLRALAAGHAGQRHRRRVCRQGPHGATSRNAHRRRGDRRAERRSARRVHQPVGALCLDLCRDHRALCGRDHRGGG